MISGSEPAGFQWISSYVFGVAQIFNLPYRSIALLSPLAIPNAQELASACRLKIGSAALIGSR